VWDAVAFDGLREAVRDGLGERANEVAGVVDDILGLTWRVDRLLAEPVAPTLGPAYDDLTGQRIALIHDGFIAAAGAERLADIRRYLEAMVHRLETVAAHPRRDQERMAEVHRAEQAYARIIDKVGTGGPADLELERIGWMIEELRVSLFAQQLRARGSISLKKILTALDALVR